jgi:cellulose synthase/poly-beta-1,6-N-acetylglucosamine synthase-like glycosyltransferase
LTSKLPAFSTRRSSTPHSSAISSTGSSSIASGTARRNEANHRRVRSHVAGARVVRRSVVRESRKSPIEIEERTVPDFVGVVIPARDEAERVERSLRTLLRATRHPHLRRTQVRIVVVDDSSTDTTAERSTAILGSRGDVVRVDVQNVGSARRTGFRELCTASHGLDENAAWFATTDADTLVRPDWLARQVRWWRSGVDALAGTVTPASWAEQTSVVRMRYAAHMGRLGMQAGHPHVHGANLSLTKSAYLAAGGMPALTTGEDHALWQAVHRSGSTALHVSDVVVATSTRREGRAPEGFSTLLRSFDNS